MHKSDWVVLFGTAGVGKSSVARQMVTYGYHYYEADDDLLPEVVKRNKNNQGLTPKLRDRQHDLIINRIEQLMSRHTKLVVACVFMWDRYRIKLRERCPQLRWVYLTTDMITLSHRVDRPDHLLQPTFALKLADLFETPSFPVEHVDNSGSLETAVMHVLHPS